MQKFIYVALFTAIAVVGFVPNTFAYTHHPHHTYTYTHNEINQAIVQSNSAGSSNIGSVQSNSAVNSASITTH